MEVVVYQSTTATARLMLWQEQIDEIRVDRSYIFDNVFATTYMYMGKRTSPNQKVPLAQPKSMTLERLIPISSGNNTLYTEIACEICMC